MWLVDMKEPTTILLHDCRILGRCNKANTEMLSHWRRDVDTAAMPHVFQEWNTERPKSSEYYKALLSNTSVERYVCVYVLNSPSWCIYHFHYMDVDHKDHSHKQRVCWELHVTLSWIPIGCQTELEFRCYKSLCGQWSNSCTPVCNYKL